MLLSAVVEIEPAPVDGMILGLLLVGVFPASWRSMQLGHCLLYV